MQVGKVVIYIHIVERYIALVLYGDRVGDLLAQRYLLAVLVGGLGHRQLRIEVFGFIRRLGSAFGSPRVLRILRIGDVVALRGCAVQNAARLDVVAGYDVFRGEFLLRAYRQLIDGLVQVGKLVVYLYIRERDIAFVLHGDRVGDRLAQFYLLAILVGSLGDRKRGVEVVGLVRRLVFAFGGLRVLRILRIGDFVALCGRAVQNLARLDVVAGYDVGRGECHGFAHTQHCNGFLHAGQLVVDFHLVERYVALVGDVDLIRDRLAQFDRLAFVIRSLLHFQRRVGAFDLIGFDFVFRIEQDVAAVPADPCLVADLARQNIIGGDDMVGAQGNGGARRDGRNLCPVDVSYGVARAIHQNGVRVVDGRVRDFVGRHVLDFNRELNSVAQLVVAFDGLVRDFLVGNQLIALDGQVAGHVGDLIQIGDVFSVAVRNRRVLRHELVLVHADERFRSVDGNGEVVALAQTFHGITVFAVRLTVVIVFAVDCSDCECNRGRGVGVAFVLRIVGLRYVRIGRDRRRAGDRRRILYAAELAFAAQIARLHGVGVGEGHGRVGRHVAQINRLAVGRVDNLRIARIDDLVVQILFRNQRIRNDNVFYGHGVARRCGYGDRVGDLLAQLVRRTVFRFAGDALYHIERHCRILGLVDRLGAAFRRLFALALFDRIRLCGYAVDNLARQHVRFGHYVGGGEFLLLTYRQNLNGLVQVGQFVVNLYIVVGVVAVVLHGDRVGDHVVQIDGLAFLVGRLGHGQRDVERFGDDVDNVASLRRLRMFLVGRVGNRIALGRCDIRYLSEQCNVVFVNHIARRERPGFSDRQFVNGPLLLGQRVIHNHVGIRHIAVIRHGDRVIDRLPELRLFAGLYVAGLGHRQRYIECFGFVRLLAFALGGLRVLRILRVGDFIALRGRAVQDAAVDDVVAGYRVGRGECLLLAHFQNLDGLVQVGQLIVYIHIVERDIAVVLDNDRVGDGFAQRYLCAVLVGSLGDRNRGIEIVGFVRLLCAAFGGLRVVRTLRIDDFIALRGYAVQNAAFENIIDGYRVGRGEYLLLAHFQYVDGLVQAGQIIVHLHIVVRHIALA